MSITCVASGAEAPPSSPKGSKAAIDLSFIWLGD